jgi:hypothetical protein
VKEFYLDMEKGNPETREIIETRLLVKHSNSEEWTGFSYLWNEDKTDAYLLKSDTTVAYTISDPQAPGGTYDQKYYYPSRAECKTCHTSAAGLVLGVKTSQLNREHPYDNATDHQLRSLNHIRMFTADIGEDYSTMPALPDPSDEKMGIQDRARSYLEANCANCHLPGGSGRSNMDLRYATLAENMNILNEPAELGDMGISDAFRLRPGAPDSSVLYLRMIHTGEFRMPPLATSVIDEHGAEVIRNWIDSLKIITALRPAHDQHIPEQFRLGTVFPNPFNPAVNIEFEVPAASIITAKIFDISGRLVKTLYYQANSSGNYRLSWDSTNEHGVYLSSGIYFINLSAEPVQSRYPVNMGSLKLILLK